MLSIVVLATPTAAVTTAVGRAHGGLPFTGGPTGLFALAAVTMMAVGSGLVVRDKRRT